MTNIEQQITQYEFFPGEYPVIYVEIPANEGQEWEYNALPFLQLAEDLELNTDKTLWLAYQPNKDATVPGAYYAAEVKEDHGQHSWFLLSVPERVAEALLSLGRAQAK